MEEDHSDTDSSQILGNWDFPPPPPPPPVKGTRVGGRVLPPWIDPSYEWGGGQWKVDGRKKKKKKESDTTDLSLKDLIHEYSSLPPQFAEWFWCIEYVAKFVKDLPCLLDLVNMGYPLTDDYGSRIDELLSLRILEFLFDPTKNDASVFCPRIEFDLSLSNTHVLHAILKDIPVSELRPGMPELSKFNVLPFIAHKNMSLPLCALEKLRDVELSDPVYRDDQPEQMDVCTTDAHTGVEQTNKDKVVDGVQTNEGDEVIVIDGNDTTALCAGMME